MTNSFISSLDQFNQGYKSKKEKLNTLVNALEEELVRIAINYRKLEEERVSINQRVYHSRQAINAIEHESQEEILDLVFKEFNTFQGFIAAYLENNLSIREDVQQQLEGLMTQDPLLENDLAEYHRFIEKSVTVINSLPSFYQKNFEEALRLQTLRLKKCLELEEKLKTLPDHSESVVPVIFTFDVENSQLFMGLPAAIRTETQDVEFSLKMDMLENSFIQLLALLAQDPDWTLLDIERTEWAGFRSLTTLVEYSGQNLIREAIQEYMQHRLIETWPFKGLTPLPEIAELDWDTWLSGRSRAGAVLDLKSVFPDIEVSAAPEKEIQSLEPAFYFFTKKDVSSWEKALHVVEGSNWTTSARRLRTMVMRLISHGRVGENSIYINDVIGGLPNEHLLSIERQLPSLVNAGIIKQEELDGKYVISLNPDHLADIQDLINRDITAFWIPLVA
jgi:hypothetical protein